MPRRRRSRESALQVLFMMDASAMDADVALRLYWDGTSRDPDIINYTDTIVRGFFEKRSEVDAAIESRSINWRLNRMSLVDRNILRIAVYEMLFLADVPGKVAIDEAIELAKRFGSEDSRAFVNGILDAVFNSLTVAT